MSDLKKLADFFGYREEEISLISHTVAKGITTTELAYFMNVVKSSGLDPFLKQIWCYKDHKNNLIILAGRDGFLTIAQRNPSWNGMVSSEVCVNDTFDVDVVNGIITHKPNFKDRGAIIGGYCYIKPKGVEIATFEWVDIVIYDKEKYIWSSHKAEMIKKVAEIHALKKAFGINGLYSEDDIIEIKETSKSDEEIESEILNADNIDILNGIRANNPRIAMSKKLTESFNTQKNKINEKG